MVTRHRALARLTRYSKALIRWSSKGIESFWILGFLLDQAGPSVHWLRDTWSDTWTCEAMRCWGFECWTRDASLPVYFWLSVPALRCCSHLARSCEVFHSWGGKTCGLLIDRSCDAWPESGDMTRVTTSTGVRKCDQSRDIRLESCLPTGVGHMTEVASSDRSRDIPTLEACVMVNIWHENLFIALNTIKG
jgi:hypothetical protein